MMVATIPGQTSSLMGNPHGELALCARGGPRDGQIVRLHSAKCAVGSAPYCTLRIRAAGIRPLHCLILRGAMRTIVRCWSGDTRLNGQAFTDAELCAGDRLSIGSVEFEVLPGATNQEPTLAIDRDTTKQQIAQVRRQGRLRAERLVALLREQRHAMHDVGALEQTLVCHRQELEKIEARLERRRSELDAGGLG